MKPCAVGNYVVLALLLFTGCSKTHPESNNTRTGSSSIDELARELMLSIVTSDEQKYVRLLHPNVVQFYEKEMPGFIESSFKTYDYLIKENASEFAPSEVVVETAPNSIFKSEEWTDARSILHEQWPIDAFLISYKKDNRSIRQAVLTVRDGARFYILLPNYLKELKWQNQRP
jgi:hypothetical protein